jgi:hypothetical protein
VPSSAFLFLSSSPVEVKTLIAFAAGSLVLTLVLPFALCLITLVHSPLPL